MSNPIADGLRFLNANDPQSPPDVGLSPRGSESPDHVMTPRNSSGRKRTNASGSAQTEKRIANKICRVCGDKAFSYNFNVITCESCKAFFRRNANKESEIRCPFNEKCEITTLSRRFCQRCRLVKCFDVGMKKEWIMTDEARLEKKARVEENRERRIQEAHGKPLPESGTRRSSSTSESRSRVVSESRADDPPTLRSAYHSPDQELPPNKVQSSSNDTSSHDQLTYAPLVVPPKSSKLSTLGSQSTFPTTQRLPLSPIHPVDFISTQPVNIPLPELPICATSPLSHNLLESVTTSAAHSLSDVTAVTSAPSGLDMSSNTTVTHSITQSGFRPPDINDGMPLGSALGTSPSADAFAASAIAHAQLAAAAQAQAHLQRQAHQMAQAAAVVAATMPTPILGQPMGTTLPTALGCSGMGNGLQPQMTHSLPPTITQVQVPLPHQNITQPMQTSTLNSGMVTIPRDVFVRLVEGANNSSLRKEKCACACLCGRYPPGSNIVDEVTKDLLATGSSHCISCESAEMKEDTKVDPATLETTEDLQKHGLLPSEQSNISWLNSSLAPTHNNMMIDEKNVLTESFYSNPSLLEEEIRSVNVDPDCCVMASQDHDCLNELVAANQMTWAMQLEGKEKKRHEDSCPTKENMVNMADGAIRRLIKMSKRVEAFRSLKQQDQIALIKASCMEYLIIRGAMAYDPNENAWKGPTPNSGFSIKMDAMKNTQENLLEQSIRFYSTFKEEHRTNESIMLLLGQLIVFNPENVHVSNRDSVNTVSNAYKRCLKRLLFTINAGDVSTTLSDYRGLVDKLDQIKDLNRRATSMVREVDSRSIEPLILEMLE